MIHPRLDKITFLFISLFVLATAGILFSVFSRASETGPITFNFSVSPTRAYRQELQAIFNDYLAGRAQIAFAATPETKTQWLDLLEKTRRQLLMLAVPAKEQSRHLFLVLQIEKMKSDLENIAWEKISVQEAELIRFFNL